MAYAEEYDRLAESACRSYLAEEKRSAALQYRRALELAQFHGDAVAAFHAGVWECDCMRSFDNRLALNRLLMVMRDMPEGADPYDVRVSLMTQFELLLHVRPELSSLAACAEEMRVQAELRGDLLAGDIHFIKGQLAYFRGDWSESEREFSAGWHAHDGLGYMKYGFAFLSALVALEQGGDCDAQDWRERSVAPTRRSALGLSRASRGSTHRWPCSVATPPCVGPRSKGRTQTRRRISGCACSTTRLVTPPTTITPCVRYCGADGITTYLDRTTFVCCAGRLPTGLLAVRRESASAGRSLLPAAG